MRNLIVILCILIPLGSFAQGKKNFKLKAYNGGMGYMGGRVQYFEGYNQKLMYANVRVGLPLIPDWDEFTQFNTMPEYKQGGAWFSMADSTKTFRLRIGFNLSWRKDSLAYQSAFSQNDIVRVIVGVEENMHGGISLGALKTTKLMFKFLRLYGGAEGEFSFSPGSVVNMTETQYFNNGDTTFLVGTPDHYEAEGKNRFHLYMSAMLGMELCFLKRIGATFEVKSGIGGHFVVGEKPVGISKNLYTLGLNYFFSGY